MAKKKESSEELKKRIAARKKRIEAERVQEMKKGYDIEGIARKIITLEYGKSTMDDGSYYSKSKDGKLEVRKRNNTIYCSTQNIPIGGSTEYRILYKGTEVYCSQSHCGYESREEVPEWVEKLLKLERANARLRKKIDEEERMKLVEEARSLGLEAN